MVEISMRAEHNPRQADGLLRDTKKVVRWLRAMSKDNIAAERSWAVLNKLLIVSAPKIGGDTSDVERDLEQREQRHNSLINGVADTAMPSPHAPNPLDSSGNTPVSLGDIPYNLFRGHFDDVSRFISVSRHRQDTMMGCPSDPASLLSQHAQSTPSTPVFHDGIFPLGLKPPIPPPPPTPRAHQSSSPPPERLKKRHSLGVSHISMPPPLQFAQWSSPESSIGFAAESAQHGKADLEAAVFKVQNDLSVQKSTGVERSTSKKRGSEAE
jgi:hypothetical protein